ncbi:MULTISPECIES: 1-acyl-sn-glycerol-3-phosphate acyltransferase [Streptomyces]|uniref:lysophospholipid acyltransferase family protein n=1 Tax=Streptomyces TaxID=1883 RepID=UPI001040A540|nr:MULTISPECIES: lysophospholipid acyltransferase family protein [Streptomyces]MBT3074774.1 1-acyl-sn-glycerol-3-phosphate acyltransferase [Streptomyces sp. COG21]MBT3081828.1 1-acyl-sn-glycerol-3-phosphate acyltransferase [Streptomyces sp. COG20]MBT3090652.1 1-acyl-sn-glycerol-3-phosphate acyltransferase [Streptomyces sp. CYG21]MBT3098093.1 1-acyl-sn-glycerol-3-phosphate acyltransferase [Streptomyces sp. CBG30]MBT3105758.1 1-acyl-sn-glycerol-3-phosphate acyltransferase [Streptomyces sp. COG19
MSASRTEDRTAPRPAGTSPWLPVAPCTPASCARHTGAARPPLRAALRLLSGCAWVLLGVVCAAPVRLLPRGPRMWLLRSWARGIPRAFGVRVTVRVHPYARGTGGGELVVANHISWLDIPLVAAVLPGRMLAKTEVRDWPLLGRLAGFGSTLFIDRDRLRALPGAVGTVAAALRSGSRVVVFPEGSTWCGRGRGGPFRPAVFQAAIDAEVSVRPVRITYGTGGAGAAAFVGDDPLTASLWRVVRAAGLTAEVHVLAPIPARAYAPVSAHGEPGRRELARAARAAVLGSDRTTTRRTATTARTAVTARTGTTACTVVTARGAAKAPHPSPAPTALPVPIQAPAAATTSAARRSPPQTAVASDRANRPSASVHH